MAQFPGMNEEGFDSGDVEPSGSFEAIPAGDYIATIASSETKETNAGTGSYLSLMFRIMEGEYKGRTVWCNLNLDNPSEQAVNIAKRALSAICKAVDVPFPKDSSELHGIPLVISVKVRPETAQYPKGNDIKGYKAVQSDIGDSFDSQADPTFDDDIPF